ncbi:hypothetical protein [Acetanaerobacterium elongatum]|uniref:Uncharacterized protein n=1 Tax=Acetanaerobacterium elongatum TaxID=258515 RepID=A0A1H0H778_9FIRM|nr:hypothetical protein [Acetanaerobacterium elongatum]SDO14920.1 hypothetical protein SAMN05192585_16211 [Acetanaerobacterium elongatum]
MEIKASTAYNKKNYTEFASFNSLKGKRPRLKHTLRIVYSIIFYCIVNQNHQLNWWYAPALKGHITGTASQDALNGSANRITITGSR